MPETMKLFESMEKLIDKTKNRENVQSLDVVEVVLVQRNLVDNQYQQTYEVLYTFTTNKSYAYLLNVKPISLVFLKTYNTEFDENVMAFKDQNSRPLEINRNVNLIFGYLQKEMTRYSIEPRTYIKGYGIFAIFKKFF